jgi:2-polyprenyl-6-methoxyphenol hydroxylase-like FAD-dependent oxidoreductase
MVPGHVLIVGCRLAGPELAVALARRNIRSTIFEIRSEKGDTGGSTRLVPNALRVLERFLGVYKEIISIHDPPPVAPNVVLWKI